jgi:putative ABC transport system permease protein
MIVHTSGEPESFAPRLRALATHLDPNLRMHDTLRLDQVGSTLWLEMAFLFRLLLLVGSIALLLSNATIYAVMAFAVSRRTREIGIRVALGADARRVVAAIFLRPLTQVAIGVVLGGALTASLSLAVAGGAFTLRGSSLVIAYSTLMLGICLLACIVPVRRALRIQPTVAMREDG